MGIGHQVASTGKDRFKEWFTLLGYFGMNPITEGGKPWLHKISTELTTQRTGAPEALQTRLLTEYTPMSLSSDQLSFYSPTALGEADHAEA